MDCLTLCSIWDPRVLLEHTKMVLIYLHDPVRASFVQALCNSFMIPVDVVPRVSAGRLVIGI